MIRRAAALPFSLVLFVAASAGAAKPQSSAEQCASSAEEGQRLRAAGSLRGAREKFTTCAQKTCPRTIQADCARWFDEATAAIPTVIFRAYGKDKQEIASAHITIDGETTATNGLPYALDPGPHVAKLTTDDGESIETKFMIAEGEKKRAVVLSLAPGGEEAQPPPPPPPPPQRETPVLAYALGGGGAAVVASGLVFWTLAASDHSALATSCATTGSCSKDAVNGVKTRALVGDVLVGAGVLLVGAAVYFYLSGSPQKATQAAQLAQGFTF